jgi:hypothetical protein
MHPLHGLRWAKAGTALLWNRTILSQITQPHQVYSLRQFLLLSHQSPEQWPDQLPSNQGRTLVVAGLDGCLDTLTPDDAQTWLTAILKPTLFTFQDWAEGEAGLIFWLPGGQHRIDYRPAQQTYHWQLNSPGKEAIPLVQCLWSGAVQDASHILLGDEKNNPDLTGKDWAGLHLGRIS